MTDADVNAAFAQAKMAGPESQVGDVATTVILDRHTIVLTSYAATDCPVSEVGVAEPEAGHLTVEVIGATQDCEGAVRSSSWLIKSEGDLIADGDPHPVTVRRGDRTMDVPVGGARLDS